MKRRSVLKSITFGAAWSWFQGTFAGIPAEALSPSSQQVAGPAWLQDAVFYQIYPQSFYDSNGDGIGDLPGLIKKLDYIHSLGCNALWLNPIFVSPFGDAGYDVADFFKVAPRYGSNEDLVRLCREAHARKMHVCLDLVAGHSSIDHPWFQESAKAKSNKYSDWYLWVPPDEKVWNSHPAPVLEGEKARSEHYVANFFPFQPALNYGYYKPDPAKKWQLPMDHPSCRAVQENLRQIMRFWLDLGVDGFRVDMASSLIRGDDTGEGIGALWQENRKWLDKNYPEAVLISEWSYPSRAIPAGFNIDFLIHFNEAAYKELVGPEYPPMEGGRRKKDVFFERAGKGDISKFVESYLANYKPTRKLGYISMPTANHDFPRPTWGRTQEEVRVMFAMLLTMPGVPFLYYGDEIGMKYLADSPNREGANGVDGRNDGIRAGSRTPMQWTKGVNAGFSSADPSKLYLPVDAAADRPSVEAQEKDPNSMLNFTRSLLRLRRQHPALANGADFEVVYAEKEKYPFIYLRTDGDEKILVAVNPSNTECSVPLHNSDAAKPLIAQGTKIEDGILKMNGVSFGIFQQKR